MSVKIVFRGVMMFVFKNRVLSEVLIPDCERKPRYGRDALGGWEHFDGSLARPHYAGMLIVPHHFGTRRVSLRGAELSVVAYNGGKDETPPKWKYPKEQRPYPPKLDFPRIGPYASRIHFRGAELETEQLSKVPILFGESESVAPVVVANADSVVLKMPNSPEETLESGQVWIYNWDSREPEVADLANIPEEEVVHSLIDADFRWLYSMLRIDPAMVFSRGMPAPWFYAEDGRTVSVSTCFPAYTEDASAGPVSRVNVNTAGRKSHRKRRDK